MPLNYLIIPSSVFGSSIYHSEMNLQSKTTWNRLPFREDVPIYPPFDDLPPECVITVFLFIIVF